MDADNRGQEMPCTPPPPPILSESDRMFIGSACQYVNMDRRGIDGGLPSTSVLDKRLDFSLPTVENENTISIMDFLENPGRLSRPRRICIIIRGPPGSGKSYVAKLIKEKERQMGDANLRILSIDDYFLVESETTEKNPKTGKKVFCYYPSRSYLLMVLNVSSVYR